MKKVFAVCNIVALIITIAINYLSNTGIFNGNTIKDFSDKYFNYFTPAGYAFSIWGLIYLALFGFVIYTGRILFRKTEDETLLEVGWWFILSCVTNSLWVIVWLYDYTGLSVLVMLVTLFSLIKIVVNTSTGLQRRGVKHYLFVYLPFAIYLGWISVALVADVSAYLTKIAWTGFGISASSWAVIMIIVAGLVNLFMISLKNIREFGFVGIWAVLAISVSNTRNNGPTEIIYTCYAVSVILLIAIIANFFKRRGA